MYGIGYGIARLIHNQDQSNIIKMANTDKNIGTSAPLKTIATVSWCIE